MLFIYLYIDNLNEGMVTSRVNMKLDKEKDLYNHKIITTLLIEEEEYTFDFEH